MPCSLVLVVLRHSAWETCLARHTGYRRVGQVMVDVFQRQSRQSLSCLVQSQARIPGIVRMTVSMHARNNNECGSSGMRRRQCPFLLDLPVDLRQSRDRSPNGSTHPQVCMQEGRSLQSVPNSSQILSLSSPGTITHPSPGRSSSSANSSLPCCACLFHSMLSSARTSS